MKQTPIFICGVGKQGDCHPATAPNQSIRLKQLALPHWNCWIQEWNCPMAVAKRWKLLERRLCLQIESPDCFELMKKTGCWWPVGGEQCEGQSHGEGEQYLTLFHDFSLYLSLSLTTNNRQMNKYIWVNWGTRLSVVHMSMWGWQGSNTWKVWGFCYNTMRV